MANASPVRSETGRDHRIKAVLGPTNTGKTHLAIERLCAHSSGAIGFPLRLLAREVYDRVCAIKGENRVALITGEERIEPKDARWLLCTAEAMPAHADLAFMALDEAQLAADRERGHIFTDRLLHARGREETMLLGSATLEPMVKALIPQAEVIGRPRFSTLSHTGPRKLSRVPPRSAIVAFSAEQVYAIAEMLRRFRGGAAVVMGALSPQTRNAQVALYQSGEVDYLVATDAIGMGLNLDVGHVAFAGLSKFDGVRQRRLTTAEMAQIAGRAGRHQQDGTFGTLAGTRHHDAAFTDEEVFAIEEHRFAPLTRLFWRESDPRHDSLATLIADLERPPERPELAPAPEAIDLAVLKRLAEDPQIADSVRGARQVARFREACSLPDFRQHGTETHARFVARLWQDLQHGELGADYVAQAIAQLDQPGGDIDTLQGRIAAIRSWAYIAQRPDWVRARDEMAARARAVEARLSDALHARLTERFVNRRTTVLMRKMGADAALLPVTLDADDVRVDGESIGKLKGFRFMVDADVRHDDRKLLLAAAERHVPDLLTGRAGALAAAIADGAADLMLAEGAIRWRDETLARLEPGKDLIKPRLVLAQELETLPAPARETLVSAIGQWLDATLKPLAALRKLAAASTDAASGTALRALLIRLVEAGGVVPRIGSGLDELDKPQRARLTRLGITVGTLDLVAAPMLRPAAAAAWREITALRPGNRAALPDPAMRPVLKADRRQPAPFGYRRLQDLWLRVDMAEKLLREAHAARMAAGRKPFTIATTHAVSMGLSAKDHAALLRLGGFRADNPPPLPEGAFGPPRPVMWRWRPPRRETPAAPVRPARPHGAFAALAELVR
ncbi:MAG: helicase [Novosphingobium sp.]|nr:helicase [Novosphingobium sp.]